MNKNNMGDLQWQRFPMDRFTLHKHFPLNRRGRDWFVGDIHGYRNHLLQALEKIGFDFSKDRLFAVGDLIDRGPDSQRTLRLFIDEPWAFSALGNHEWIMIRELEGDPKMIKLAQEEVCGAHWRTRESLSTLNHLAEEICANFPIALTVEVPDGNIGVIHAHPPLKWSTVTALPPREEALDSWTNWLWSREGAKNVVRGLPVTCEGIDAVICGHTTLDKSYWKGNVFYADTFLSWSGEGKLTLIEAEALLKCVRATPGRCKA